MAGELLLELKKLKVFKPTVMDTIVNEFAPETDQFKVTDAFLPFQNVEKDSFLDMIKFGAFGRTYPVELGAEHRRIDLPGQIYKEGSAGYWREGMVFNEEVLQNAMNPASPMERMAGGLVTDGLNILDSRLNNLIEYLSVQTVCNGWYSEARNGVNYVYDPQIPPYHYIDISKTTGAHQIQWAGTGGVWTTAASAKPITDIKGAILFARDIGLNPQKIWANDQTWAKAEEATDTQSRFTYLDKMLLANLTNESVFETLTNIKGLQPVVDNRISYEEAKITAASAAGDTTVTVDLATNFVAGDKVIIKKSDGTQMFDKVASITGSVVTLTDSVGLKYAVAIGDRIIRSRKLFPDNIFIIESPKQDRMTPNRWISTPSLVKAASWSKTLPGKYTWTYFQERVPYLLEIGAGINGGPRITNANWLVVKVGTNNDINWR
jgi:hypothetical protein